ncbi:Nucleotide-binding universal stress protein, UspA family [Pricia antarctica]|uniref:Nucleotide-binding universal stress protein, UspA family n=1 Tax=Pricia antarctica TaxID=641691 RepID=A0A1G7D1E1_9FLAO|nr:universal stress protein [Pricia antarctica]SDE45303.1 Nucleotide-binding universal stress protein, UspA family [Pricia antarctica]
MKTILYATDYSKNSVAALKYAQKFSKTMDSLLVVTHVFGYGMVTESVVLDDPELRKNALKANRTRLEEFCKEYLGEDRKKTNIQIVPIENMSIVDGVIGVASEWHAQIIVVGTKGESVLKEIFMGSTAKQLIEKAPCPIMTIPTEANYKPFKTIVYATDFEEEDVYAIKKLSEFAERFEAEIKMVHISTKKAYSGETQMEWFKDALLEKVDYGPLEFQLLLSENIFEALRTYLGDVGADLVVMLERKKSGFLKKWYHADKVKKMETYGKVPLLSFNEGNHEIFHFSAEL